MSRSARTGCQGLAAAILTPAQAGAQPRTYIAGRLVEQFPPGDVLCYAICATNAVSNSSTIHRGVVEQVLDSGAELDEGCIERSAHLALEKLPEAFDQVQVRRVGRQLEQFDLWHDRRRV